MNTTELKNTMTLEKCGCGSIEFHIVEDVTDKVEWVVMCAKCDSKYAIRTVSV